MPIASCFRRNSPARCPASPFRKSNRGCFPSTTRLGPAPPPASECNKAWSRSTSPYYTQTLEALAKFYKFTLDTKWKDLGKKVQDAILYGSGDDAIRFVYDDGLRSYETRKPFEGVVTNLERRWRETDSDWAREEMA